MRLYFAIIVLVQCLPFACSNPPAFRASSPIPPPAARPLLTRGALLDAYDFPADARSRFDTRLHQHSDYGILGPPGFWTLPSLYAHYQVDIHFRYHPFLYHTIPPFSVWFKEQQLIRAINLLSNTIELNLARHDVGEREILQLEMQLGELSVLLRLTQIATTLRYASISRHWRRFEESMFRIWASFLEVSQRVDDEDDRMFRDSHMRRIVDWVHTLERESSMDLGVGGRGLDHQQYGAGGSRGQTQGWGTATTGNEQGLAGPDLRSSTPRRWSNSPGLGSPGLESEAVAEELREALGQRFHF